MNRLKILFDNAHKRKASRQYGFGNAQHSFDQRKIQKNQIKILNFRDFFRL